MNPLLDVGDLRVTFPSRRGPVRAVDGVSFSIGVGRTLGLVGESGSGKSVAALSLMRLLDSRGRIEPGSRITFAGDDVLALPPERLRQVRGAGMAMVFQEPMTALNPLFTIGDQIAEAIQAHRGGSRDAAREQAVEALALVGMPDPRRRARSYPHELSGGMRQRAVIAIAVSCEPGLLIADEPTTALDMTVQAQILELMRDLRERTGMAMLLITHNLGVVAELADDVAVMYAGQIVEYGPVRRVLRSPQHPYTQALLASMPVLGSDKDAPLRVIRGSVPSPLEWPGGCRFAPRCDFAFARCGELPPLIDVAGGRARCWLREEGDRDAA
jgi:oligopeptide/dipeptide ABC transporter ATP-binding protein